MIHYAPGRPEAEAAKAAEMSLPDTITIALLTRNAGPLLERVLGSVRAQKTDRRVELLAVDSGSTDGTVERLRDFGARVVSIRPEDFNFGTTRELAYREAAGVVVVNLSQDAVPAREDWLENLLRPLEDPSVGVSCGASIPDPERGTRQFAWERNGYFYFTREMRQFTARYGKGVSFANSAVPRSVWERFHFDPIPLGEDFQFQRKLVEAGFRAAFPEDAPVYHHHTYTTGPLYRRCRDEGRALRRLGVRYTELDLVRDLLGPRKYVQWLRELRHGRLRGASEVLFPVIRALAVYVGNRLGREG